MNKKLLIAAVIIALLLFVQRKTIKKTISNLKDYSSNIFSSIKNSFSESQLGTIYNAISALIKAGCPIKSLPFVVAQIAFETGHFKSSEAHIDNNLSGIKYFGQSGATKGQFLKPSKQEAGGYYAHYNTIEDWAADYLRILNTVGSERPLNSTTAESFVHALKMNKYFEADEKTYSKGVDSLAKFYTPFISAVINF